MLYTLTKGSSINMKSQCISIETIFNKWFYNKFDSYKNIGSGALPSKLLLATIIENAKIYAYFRLGKVKINFVPQG